MVVAKYLERRTESTANIGPNQAILGGKGKIPMPLLAQICILIVTVALVAVAVVSIRLMLQTKALIENANVSLGKLPALLEDVQRTSDRADELLHAFSRITRSAESGVSAVEQLTNRATGLASSLLDEVERPIAQTVGIMRGIRAGAQFLMQRWQTRGRNGSNTIQGDEYVGEQRWLDDGGVPARRSSGRRFGSDARADGR
ncbi:MAG: hypothetical protein HOP12_02125 [Candidatus Eisenbacteria bacterium]|uniref:DUF948 domain-containing protein n=1 Tax=Eiseniibacteriota bacterium TaxID=2212470 RepID=A0A849SB99_UNCEI|nr:hypothetical protein [Candidatus Eisenbacteria bacterium]